MIVEDEEMDYEDDYPEELDYGDEMSQDGEEDVSDEDEVLGDMGHIEGLPGHPVDVEVVMGEDEEDDEADDDEESDSVSDDDLSEDGDEDDEDEVGSEDDDLDDQIEIVDEEGNALADDGASGWESETDDDDDGEDDDENQDYDDGVQDLDELADIPNPLHLQELVDGHDMEGHLHHLDHHHHHHPHHILAEEGFNFADRLDDEAEEDGKINKQEKTALVACADCICSC